MKKLLLILITFASFMVQGQTSNDFDGNAYKIHKYHDDTSAPDGMHVIYLADRCDGELATSIFLVEETTEFTWVGEATGNNASILRNAATLSRALDNLGTANRPGWFYQQGGSISDANRTLLCVDVGDFVYTPPLEDWEQSLVDLGFTRETETDTFDWEITCGGTTIKVGPTASGLQWRENGGTVSVNGFIDAAIRIITERVDTLCIEYPADLPNYFHFLYPDYYGSEGINVFYRDVGNGILVFYRAQGENTGYTVFLNDVLQNIGGRTSEDVTTWLDANYTSVAPHEFGDFREIQASRNNRSRYRIEYEWNPRNRADIHVEVRDDITGESVHRDFNHPVGSGSGDIRTRSFEFEVDRIDFGSRHRLIITISGGAGGDITQTFYGDIRTGGRNIVVTDITRRSVTFRVLSDENNGADRINVSARSTHGDRVNHASYGGWSRPTPTRVLAGGYVKEYKISPGRAIEDYETARISAYRDGESEEYTPAFQLNGPTPELTVRLSRDAVTNTDHATYRMRTDWTLDVSNIPGWSNDQIVSVETSVYSDERTCGICGYRSIRIRQPELSINAVRGRFNGDSDQNQNFWRYTDNQWAFTLRFIRMVEGRAEAYTLRYFTSNSENQRNAFQPRPNQTSTRTYRYLGAAYPQTGTFNFSGNGSQWSIPTFPSGLTTGQR